MFYGLLQLVSKLWIRWQKPILWVLIAGMAAKAFSRIPYGFSCLLFLKGPNPAVDLLQRYNEVHFWFAGENIYSQLKEGGVYPPASHVILLPFLNYSSWPLVRSLWAITSLIALIGLSYLLLRSSKASSFREKTFIALISLTTYATNANIINGQLTIHILIFLLAGLALINKNLDSPNSWKIRLLAGFCIAFALVKPTVTLPFFLILLFVPSGRLVAVFTSIIYGGFALIATAFQNSNIIKLHLDWLERGTFGAEISSGGNLGLNPTNANQLGGYGDIHSFLAAIEFSDFNTEFSIIILAIFAVWLYFHRQVDVWILIGIAALISRFWAYHRMYDDMVIILPMVTLFRLTKQTNVELNNRVLSGIMLAIATVSIFLIDQLLLLNPPNKFLFINGQVIVWLLMLGFLLFQAFLQRKQPLNLKNQQPNRSYALSKS